MRKTLLDYKNRILDPIIFCVVGYVICHLIALAARFQIFLKPRLKKNFPLLETMSNLEPLLLPGDRSRDERYLVRGTNMIVHASDWNEKLQKTGKYIIVENYRRDGQWIGQEIALEELLEKYPEKISGPFLFNLHRFVSHKLED